MKKIFQNKGFMVLEVIIAVSIIAVSILAMMAVTERSVYVEKQSFYTTQASFLLEEGAEAVRILRDNAWNNISSLTVNTNYYPAFLGGTWTLSSTPNTVGIFTRTVSVANVNRDDATGDISVVGTNDIGTKIVTVSVSWLSSGTTTVKTLQFYIIDIFS